MSHFTDRTVHFDDWRLPSHWASALINDDWTGYDQDETAQIEDVLFRSGLSKYPCLNVEDDSSFQECPSYWPASYELLAGNYSTFTFQLR
jgi:hypothetical protein